MDIQIRSLRFWAGIAIALIPAIGLLLVVLAWLAPTLSISYSLGVNLFLIGWLVWSFVMPALTPQPCAYAKQVIFHLFFFPVMYPFIIALFPWAIALNARTAEMERGIRDGTMKFEIKDK